MELYNDPVITKYSTDFVVSFEELATQYSQIKPKNIPIYDFCVIKLLGTFAYNLANYYKWKSAPELVDQMEQIVRAVVPTLNYNKPMVQIIYQNLVEKREPPYTFKSQFIDFIDSAYKVNIDQNNKDDLLGYLNFRNVFINKMDELFDQYKLQWKQIDKQSDKASDKLMDNFAHLEEDETFEASLNVIEEIKNEAGNQIDTIIKKYENKITQSLSTINYEETGIIEFQSKVKEFRESIYDDFDQEVNSTYLNVITKRKFSNDMTQLLMTFFDVDKSMYKLNLSLGTSLNVFAYLFEKKASNNII